MGELTGYIESAQAQAEQTPQLSQEVLDARNKLYGTIEKEGPYYYEGMAMPEGVKQFHETVKRVAEKLKAPSDVQVIVVDTEESNAYYQPNARIIMVTRGIFRMISESKYFTEENITFSEDHMAAILSHEIVHSKVVTKEYLEALEHKKFGERIGEIFSHAQEYEADVQGMINMDQAGYNPKAMVEILAGIGLTNGRYDNAHPEVQDRIRNLEDVLFNDTDPLLHVDDSYKKLDDVLVAWIQADSEIYASTEELIGASLVELHRKLMTSTTLEEFWKVFFVHEHRQKIVIAQEILRQQPEVFRELLRELLVRQILEKFGAGSEYDNALIDLTARDPKNREDEEEIEYVEGEKDYAYGDDKEEEVKSWSDEEGDEEEEYEDSDNRWEDEEEESEEENYIPNETGEKLQEWLLHYTQSGIEGILHADGYREQALHDHVEFPGTISTRSIADELELAAIYLGEVREATISALHDTVKEIGRWGDMEPELRRKRIEKLYEALSFLDYFDGVSLDDPEFVRDVLDFLDTQKQDEQDREGVEKRRARGFRAPDSEHKFSLDLTDPQKREEVLSQLALNLAIVVQEKPEITEDMKGHFAELIEQNLNLPEHLAREVANIVLGNGDYQSYIASLNGYSKLELGQMAQVLDKLRWMDTMRISPLRDQETSYMKSFDHGQGDSIYYGGDDSLNEKISRLQEYVGKMLFFRSLPKEQQSNQYHEYQFESLKDIQAYDVASLDITLEEWNFLVNNHIFMHGEEMRDVWVLKKIASGDQNPDLIESISDMHGLGTLRYLSSEEFGEVVDRLPWSAKKWHSQLQYMEYDFKWVPQEAGNRRGLAKAWEKLYKKLPEYCFGDKASRINEKRITQAYMGVRTNYSYGDFPSLSDDLFSPHGLSARLLELRKYEIKSRSELPKGERSVVALIEAIRSLTIEGYTISLLSLNKQSQQEIMGMSDQQLMSLIQIFTDRAQEMPLDTNQQMTVDILQLWKHRYTESERESLEGYKANGLNILHTQFIKDILEKDGVGSLEWVIQHMSPTALRDQMVIGLLSLSEGSTKEQLQTYALSHMTEILTDHNGYIGERDTSRFPYQNWALNKFNPTKREDMRQMGHEGTFVRENFPDMLQRRYAFSTMAESAEDQLSAVRFYGPYYGIRKGSMRQHFEAEMLESHEQEIFDTGLQLTQKISLIVQLVPYKSPVRDIWLEGLLRQELQGDSTDEMKVEAADKLLGLFTGDSGFKTHYQIQALRLVFKLHPELKQSFKEGLSTITKYLPAASLARNYFLSQLENSEVFLTREQLQTLKSLQMSREGKKDKQDNSPMTFVFDGLSELERGEKVDTMLWLLGVEKNGNIEKPKSIKNLEERYAGHLDGLPGAIAAMTPPEREALFKRMFLGAEGIFDLDSVPADNLAEAKTQRDTFIKLLAENLLSEAAPNERELFIDLFLIITDASEPAHAAEAIGRILDAMYEAKTNGNQLTPEEVVTVGLSELGLVGKKVAQKLGEMVNIPENYRHALQRVQTEGPIVPKRAVLAIAENEGLFEPTKGRPYKIVSLGNLLGAASNKQAIAVEVEFTEDSGSHKKGDVMKVALRCKRPSVQKTDNLRHDLRVLGKIAQHPRFASHLPSNFVERVKDTVMEELDFRKEAAFAKVLGEELALRNRGEKVKITIPEILYAGEHAILETLAEGESLRSVIDNNDGSRNYTNLMRDINSRVIKEVLGELAKGNFHIDLHPGNIFIQTGKNASLEGITFIDLGMHVQLSESQRKSTKHLIRALSSGDKEALVRALKDFSGGTSSTVDSLQIQLKKHEFATNIAALFTASGQADLPKELLSLIFGLSILGEYARKVDKGVVGGAVLSYLFFNR